MTYYAKDVISGISKHPFAWFAIHASAPLVHFIRRVTYASAKLATFASGITRPRMTTATSSRVSRPRPTLMKTPHQPEATVHTKRRRATKESITDEIQVSRSNHSKSMGIVRNDVRGSWGDVLLCQGVNNVTQHLIPPVIDATTESDLSLEEDETTNGRRTYTVDEGSWVVDRQQSGRHV